MKGFVKKLLRFVMKKKTHFSRRTGVPPGHVPVSVGLDARTSVIVMEARQLNHPLLKKLLQLSVEEFGNSYRGSLRIACDVDLFLSLVKSLSSRDSLRHCVQLDDLFSKFSAHQDFIQIDRSKDVLHIGQIFLDAHHL
ncbi:Auxin-responsive protein [Nymphaea thermarum]|nr:Auxin-responsive protein [Nymphaea thermarum]